MAHVPEPRTDHIWPLVRPRGSSYRGSGDIGHQQAILANGDGRRSRRSWRGFCHYLPLRSTQLSALAAAPVVSRSASRRPGCRRLFVQHIDEADLGGRAAPLAPPQHRRHPPPASVCGVRIDRGAGIRMIWDRASATLSCRSRVVAGATLDLRCSADQLVSCALAKFIGGPGASGILIVRRDAVSATKPSWPGGSTRCKFVSPKTHDYSDSLEAREEAGTPNVVGDIRAALALSSGTRSARKAMAKRNHALARRAFNAWQDPERLEILGLPTPDGCRSSRSA